MTTNSQNQPDYSQWLTKQQAADVLDVSTKTIEAFAESGKLQTTRWRRPSGGPKISVYHPADVETLRRERFPDAESPFVMPAPASFPPMPRTVSQKSENGTNDIRIDGRANAAMLQLLRNLLNSPGSQKLLEASEKRKPEVPLHHRVYLTVREAAAYLGRPERHIRAMIQSGELPANTAGHTRVRRRDLDGL